FYQAEDGIRDRNVTGVQTCALPICNNTDGFADINQVARSHGLAVALRTNTSWGLTSQYGTYLNFGDASVNQLLRQFLSQVRASFSNNVAFSILDVGCNNAARC